MNVLCYAAAAIVTVPIILVTVILSLAAKRGILGSFSRHHRGRL
jgi:hypothetical protein